MRILHLDPDDMDNPLSGGGSVRNYEIYRRLAHRHQITVLTPTFPGSTPTLERDGVPNIMQPPKMSPAEMTQRPFECVLTWDETRYLIHSDFQRLIKWYRGGSFSGRVLWFFGLISKLSFFTVFTESRDLGAVAFVNRDMPDDSLHYLHRPKSSE